MDPDTDFVENVVWRREAELWASAGYGICLFPLAYAIWRCWHLCKPHHNAHEDALPSHHTTTLRDQPPNLQMSHATVEGTSTHTPAQTTPDRVGEPAYNPTDTNAPTQTNLNTSQKALLTALCFFFLFFLIYITACVISLSSNGDPSQRVIAWYLLLSNACLLFTAQAILSAVILDRLRICSLAGSYRRSLTLHALHFINLTLRVQSIAGSITLIVRPRIASETLMEVWLVIGVNALFSVLSDFVVNALVASYVYRVASLLRRLNGTSQLGHASAEPQPSHTSTSSTYINDQISRLAKRLGLTLVLSTLTETVCVFLFALAGVGGLPAFMEILWPIAMTLHLLAEINYQSQLRHLFNARHSSTHLYHVEGEAVSVSVFGTEVVVRPDGSLAAVAPGSRRPRPPRFISMQASKGSSHLVSSILLAKPRERRDTKRGPRITHRGSTTTMSSIMSVVSVQEQESPVISNPGAYSFPIHLNPIPTPNSLEQRRTSSIHTP